jgi:D-alanyl-D-alanine dipeptidase
VAGWKDVPIEERGEPLVLLNNLPDSYRIGILSAYYEGGMSGSIPEVYLRKTVTERLVLAAKFLAPGYKFLVWDGWRPLDVQQALFNGYYTQIRVDNPDLKAHEIEERAQTFVSIPSERQGRPSPHFTGGAVDLTIADKNNNSLWMGTQFDDFSSAASSNYFEDPNHVLTEADKVARQNRRVLLEMMAKVGFTHYPEEWWHFDFGDQFWARMTGRNRALLGPVDLHTFGVIK